MQRWCRSAASVTLSLSGAFRCMGSFSMSRNVQMVSAVLSDGDDAAGKAAALEEGEEEDFESADGNSAGEADRSIVKIGAAEMQALPRTFRGATKRKSCLSPEERQRLMQMIFETHYAAEGHGRGDRAMWYQSALELHWLEEWAHDKCVVGEGEEEVRCAVKKAVLQRVDLHKPLAYIMGHQPFYGCNIRCSPPLLCPRPETEMWTHWLVRHHLDRATDETCVERAPLQVLDMCCGTGCIGIAIATHVPHAEVLAVDIMDEAVKMSNENAKLNKLDSGRYRAMKSDMFEAFLQGDCNDNTNNNNNNSAVLGCKSARVAKHYVGSFDLIVSNPPYILPEQYVELPPGIRLWESKLALVGDARRELQQYLYFQELCELGAAMLKPKVRRNATLIKAPNFVVEVGLQAEHVASLMERSGMWEDVEIHLDYAKQMRWISASSSH